MHIWCYETLIKRRRHPFLHMNEKNNNLFSYFFKCVSHESIYPFLHIAETPYTQRDASSKVVTQDFVCKKDDPILKSRITLKSHVQNMQKLTDNSRFHPHTLTFFSLIPSFLFHISMKNITGKQKNCTHIKNYNKINTQR